MNEDEGEDVGANKMRQQRIGSYLHLLGKLLGSAEELPYNMKLSLNVDNHVTCYFIPAWTISVYVARQLMFEIT